MLTPLPVFVKEIFGGGAWEKRKKAIFTRTAWKNRAGELRRRKK